MSQTGIRRGVLVIFPGALGDFVCFLPALEELRRRHPDEPLTLLCKHALRGIAELAGVSSVLPIEGRASAWLFSASPPVEADVFFGAFATTESFTGAGVAEVERNLERWGGRAHLFRRDGGEHFAVECLRAIGATPERPPVISLPGSLCSPPGLNRRPRLVVQPGSGRRDKRWSREGFQALLRGWSREIGPTITVLGPAEESERRDWRLDGEDPLVLDDALDLVRALSREDVYLGNDSGASHLASALGLRSVVLFGPSDSARWAPLGERSRVHRPDPWTPLDGNPPPGVVREIERLLRTGRGEGSP